jgi:hypothetical protein
MGYTRHFEFKPNLDSNKFASFAEDVKKIYAKSEEIGIPLCETECETDCPPVANSEYIHFNAIDDPFEDLFIDVKAEISN